MKNEFKLGFDIENEPFTLPESIITETIAVLGIRGSGKTTTAKVIVEEALKKQRQVAIIDPTDAWWGLKSGFEIFVFGGAHGDLPLDEGQGRLLADFVVDNNVSIVLSLRNLRKAAQKRLITAFNEQLYFRKGEASKRTPILVVIDECDSFIPQKVMGEDAKSVGAVEDLVRRGRNAGIGVVLISQRAASINKDVLTQLTVLIAHKHTSPQDRKALEDWIRGHDSEDRAKVFLSTLAALPVGIAWVWAPDLDLFEKVAVRKADTFDSSATPKLGSKLSVPKTLKVVDIELLKEQMQEAVVQHEANDPNKLKEQIKKLKKELESSKLTAMPSAQALKSIEEFKIKLSQALNANEQLENSLKAIKSICDKPYLSLPVVQKISAEVNLKEHQKANVVISHKPHLQQNIISSNISVSTGMKRMLIALAQKDSLVDKQVLAILCGMKHSSGTFSTYISSLCTKGLIKKCGQSFEITPNGRQEAGDYESLPTGSALLNYWLGKLGTGEQKILNVFTDFVKLNKSQLENQAGFSENSGTFSTYLSKLVSLGLIKKIEGRFELSSELYD